jgi:hypothetical protein
MNQIGFEFLHYLGSTLTIDSIFWSLEFEVKFQPYSSNLT